MRQFFQKYRLPLALSIVLLALVFSMIQTTPKINNTSPANGALGVDLNSDIVITFNKPISPSKLTVQSVPPENFTISVDKNTATLSHSKSFYQNQTYLINFYYNRQKLGSLSFTTQKQQNNPRDLQKIEEETKRDYPLADKTPYKRPTFEVVYIAPLTLRVELYEPNLDKQAITQEVKAWIKSLGEDPNSHKIIFLDPTLPSPTTYR